MIGRPSALSARENAGLGGRPEAILLAITLVAGRLVYSLTWGLNLYQPQVSETGAAVA